MSVLGTAKHSSCNQCIDTWQSSCIVLSGDEKYCDLDLAQKFCMENFNLKEAGGKLMTMMMKIMTSPMVMVMVRVIIIMMVMVKMIMVLR